MSAPSTIVVALSGGVDSATAAAVLLEAGHRVIGITMRLYNAQGTAASAGGRCCGPRDIEDARRVARHLGIPFYVVSFESAFERHVMQSFVDSYLAGETPNPCARCNQHIKFTPLLKRARALGADFLATGHYARIEHDAIRPRLLRGVDRTKDQSYFLATMPSAELASIWFPLGGLTKEEVRALAARYRLPNASKPESQEICFVPDGDYAGFVEARSLARGRSAPVPGPVVDHAGEVLGQHDGIHRYTVGQRRGLGNLRGQDPLYVVAVDAQHNRVVVGPREAAARTLLHVGELQWFMAPPRGPLSVQIQVRHGGRTTSARVHTDALGARVELDTGVVAAPGQAAVFYDGDEVIGGGFVRADAPTAQGSPS